MLVVDILERRKLLWSLFSKMGLRMPEVNYWYNWSKEEVEKEEVDISVEEDSDSETDSDFELGLDLREVYFWKI